MRLTLIGVAALAGGCGGDEAAQPAASPSPAVAESRVITCTFSMRRSLETSQFKTRELTVRADQDEPEAALGPFRARLLYFDDGFEGRSLNVYVYSVEGRRLLTQDLYQLGDGLQNQFEGDQGFSGLRYVRNPDSRAELQYFCEVAP